MKDVYKILHEIAERRSNWIKMYRREPKEVYINEKIKILTISVGSNSVILRKDSDGRNIVGGAWRRFVADRSHSG